MKIKTHRTILSVSPLELMDYLMNLRLKWRFKSKLRTSDSFQTSVSDVESYLEVVDQALSDPKIFEKFRSNADYRFIVGGTNRKLSIKYLDIVKQDNEVYKKLKLLYPDDLGKPYKYYLKGFGRIAPDNIKYAKIVSDLTKFFGTMKDFRIGEIGIGYGGQALAINKLCSIASYNLIDLPQVVLLAKKFLSLNGVNHKIYNTTNEQMPMKLDLLISNYAFSELHRDLQVFYLHNLIEFSLRGYMIYNFISGDNLNSLSLAEIRQAIPDAEIFGENPLTHKNNVLIVWDRS
jgi:hypothetical protein